MSQHITLRVRAIVLNDGKLLCVRQKPYNEFASEGNNWWCLPGGKVEPDEALKDAIKREMLEETGVAPVVGNLLYIQQFPYKGEVSLEFFFHVQNSKDYETINLGQTTHGNLEIAEINFIDPQSANLLPEFLKTEDLTAHVASNAPTKLFSRF